MTAFSGRLDGTGLRIALVCSRFNDLIVERLESGARDVLVRHGVADDAIDTMWVPGAWEIPMAAKAMATTGRYDAVVGLGAVIRGATYHFEVVANQSAAGLARVALDTGVVVTNGIITVDSIEQALERAGSKAGNKGADAAMAALETVAVIRLATT
jgi:6,7-dimethyl-8-ribityllumazine synthase